MTGQRLLARWILFAALFGGVYTVAFTDIARAQAVLWKRCSKCNRGVPITSQVGQTCPHCGAYCRRPRQRPRQCPDGRSSSRYRVSQCGVET
jgi:hypothetical protein